LFRLIDRRAVISSCSSPPPAYQLQRFGISHAGLFVINRLVVMLGQVGINLRARAIDHHQADAQAVQRPMSLTILENFHAQWLRRPA
jgi:hypothetical protein